ncbi:MAG: nucleoside triphosphate pyrophosphohydrolase [Flavobacteriaceae bacterium]|nr:nucleoside triphosphate pyrophosphohydrolase [Flavobacteriaceae bacterium]
MPVKDRKLQLEAFSRLLDIMDDLREKCPWDRKQTFESLRTLTIEETYELSDAIADNDLEEVRKELGDLLLHIVFYAKLGEEAGAFDVATIANGICEKLIVRHPHIYADVKVSSEEDVKKNWEKIKLKEGKTSVLEGVPRGLSSVIKAQRIQEKAAGVGFEWEKTADVLAKVKEEWDELEVEIARDHKEHMEQEFGDLLFSMINLSRFLKINPENALERTNKKFIKRFQFIEEQARASNKMLADMTLEEMDELWKAAKNQ